MSYNIRNLPPKYATPQLLYGRRNRKFPIAYDPTHFTVEEEYLVKRANYVPQARNTKNSFYPTAFLVDETVTREEQDGVWFTRMYSTVPAAYVDYTTSSVVYPGLAGLRPPQPARTVVARITRGYALIGPEAWAHYPTVDAAPYLPQTTLWAGGWGIGYILGGNTLTLESFTATTGGAEPGVTVEPLTVGGWIFESMKINETIDNALTTYLGLITADKETQASYSIIAEPTIPSRYSGNIWMFETISVKAA